MKPVTERSIKAWAVVMKYGGRADKEFIAGVFMFGGHPEPRHRGIPIALFKTRREAEEAARPYPSKPPAGPDGSIDAWRLSARVARVEVMVKELPRERRRRYVK